MKKRLMILAVMTVLLLAPVLSAQAGQNRMDVAAEERELPYIRLVREVHGLAFFIMASVRICPWKPPTVCIHAC